MNEYTLLKSRNKVGGDQFSSAAVSNTRLSSHRVDYVYSAAFILATSLRTNWPHSRGSFRSRMYLFHYYCCVTFYQPKLSATLPLFTTVEIGSITYFRKPLNIYLIKYHKHYLLWLLSQGQYVSIFYKIRLPFANYYLYWILVYKYTTTYHSINYWF